MITAEEAIGLLDLVSCITIRCKRIEQGEIVIYTDNKTMISEICKPIKKESDTIEETRATIATIREKIKKSKINIIVIIQMLNPEQIKHSCNNLGKSL